MKEINMALDLTKTGKQDEPFPAGIYRLKAKLMTGTAGPDFNLQRAKTSIALMLPLELTVVDGEHKNRKLFDYPTVDLVEEDLITPNQEALDKVKSQMKYGHIKLRAIVDSAFGLNPDDESEKAQAVRRRFNSYNEFDGIVFSAPVKIAAATKDYAASNKINWIIVDGKEGYPERSDPKHPKFGGDNNGGGSGAVIMPPLAQQKKWEMDDEIPFVLAFLIAGVVTLLVTGGSTLIA
jgi:hypothetical protein